MKLTFSLLLVTFAYIASAVPIEEAAPAYPTEIEFSEEDGVMNDIDLEGEVDEELLTNIAARNLYLLFTRNNPSVPQVLTINDAASIRNSFFNPNHRTVVIVHGWLSNQNTGINARIRDAYLNRGDHNVIVLEWRRLARANYVTAVRGVPKVGKGLGQFIRYLAQVTGARYEDMHLVGFSLGAHLVGNAGRELGGQIARITGLDPAGPLWNLNSNRLHSGDARYVEAIHTNGGVTGLGIGTAIADADFFPNGGNSQPGCLTPICDHNRAWNLFASSVTYDHLVGNYCNSALQITLNTCRGPQLRMGNSELSKSGYRGRYRLSTRRRYPF